MKFYSVILFTEEDNKVLQAIEDRVWYGECRTFIPDSNFTSATKCKLCSKEKGQHKFTL